MKLLVLTSTYPYLEIHRHPRFINTLCQRLKRYFDLYVLAPSLNGRPAAKTQSELALFRYCIGRFEILSGGDGVSANLTQKPWLFMVVPFFFLSQIIYCRQMALKKRIQVIHAHWIIPQGFAAVLSRLIFRLKFSVVVTAHGGDLYGLKGRLMTGVKRWTLGRADHITVVSRTMKEYCVAHLGCSPDCITVRSMGVDLTGQFVPGNEMRDPCRLVFVGRMVEKKGVDVLIRAMAQVVKEEPDIHLDIIGGGRDLESYMALALRYGLSGQIHFHGFVPNGKIPLFYQRAGLAIMPFRVARDGDQEGLGLTTVEAIGCGCVVIASDLPAVRDVIRDGETGFLVPPEDPGALADKIVEVMTALGRGNTLCPRARELTVEKFDWDIVAKSYARLLSGSGGSGVKP